MPEMLKTSRDLIKWLVDNLLSRRTDEFGACRMSKHTTFKLKWKRVPRSKTLRTPNPTSSAVTELWIVRKKKHHHFCYLNPIVLPMKTQLHLDPPIIPSSPVLALLPAPPPALRPATAAPRPAPRRPGRVRRGGPSARWVPWVPPPQPDIAGDPTKWSGEPPTQFGAPIWPPLVKSASTTMAFCGNPFAPSPLALVRHRPRLWGPRMLALQRRWPGGRHGIHRKARFIAAIAMSMGDNGGYH